MTVSFNFEIFPVPVLDNVILGNHASSGSYGGLSYYYPGSLFFFPLPSLLLPLTRLPLLLHIKPTDNNKRQARKGPTSLASTWSLCLSNVVKEDPDCFSVGLLFVSLRALLLGILHLLFFHAGDISIAGFLGFPLDLFCLFQTTFPGTFQHPSTPQPTFWMGFLSGLLISGAYISYF